MLSVKNLLKVLSTGSGKSIIFQMLVRMKQIMASKLSIAVGVCSLQSIVYDQMEETSSIALTAVSFTDCRFKDVGCSKYQLIFAPQSWFCRCHFLSQKKKKSPHHSTHRLHVCLFCRMTNSYFDCLPTPFRKCSKTQLIRWCFIF